MKLGDAIESGRKFKRPRHTGFMDATESLCNFYLEDIFADDWELGPSASSRFLEVFSAWHPYHVFLNLKTAELKVMHINECPIQSVLLGTEDYQFSDYEYLGAL